MRISGWSRRRSGSITASRAKRPRPDSCTLTVTRYACARDAMRNEEGMSTREGVPGVAETAAAPAPEEAAAADRISRGAPVTS
jgi:hypothetical protein